MRYSSTSTMASRTMTLMGSSFPTSMLLERRYKLWGKMLVDAGLSFWSNPDWRIRVTDETGTLVLSITMRGDDAEKR